jgi:hypothetical protein
MNLLSCVNISKHYRSPSNRKLRDIFFPSTLRTTSSLFCTMVSSSSSYLTNTIAIGVCILLIISQRHVSYAFTTQLAPLSQQQSVAVSQHHQQTKLFTSSTTVQPTSTSTIGTVGSGYLPILLAKLAAHRSHGKSWIICPSADVDLMQQLTSLDGYDKTLSNLELVPASNTDRVEDCMQIQFG